MSSDFKYIGLQILSTERQRETALVLVRKMHHIRHSLSTK